MRGSQGLVGEGAMGSKLKGYRLFWAVMKMLWNYIELRVTHHYECPKYRLISH